MKLTVEYVGPMTPAAFRSWVRAYLRDFLQTRGIDIPEPMQEAANDR